MLFATLVTAALAAFWVWYREADETARRLCWVAIAAAVLTKGPAGAALPTLAIVLFLAWQRRLSELRALASGWPVGLAVAVVVGWYVAAYRTAGADFLHVQILHENVQRLLGGGDFAQTLHRRLKLPVSFAGHLFPWNLVLVWSVWRWWHGAPTTPTDRFLHAWWIAIVALFAIAARTRGVYLLPAHPAVALLAAQALAPYAMPVLRTTIAAAAVAVLAAVQLGRLATADAEPLRVFAERIQARVGAAPVLRAAAALPENDALVLRWRLDRSIRRGPLRCDPGMPTLAPRAALEHAESLGLQAVEVADTPAGGIALLECSRDRVVHR